MRYYYNPERLKQLVKSLTAEYKRLAYFKKELLAQLEKQEAKEKHAIKKAILKAELLQKAGFGVGTVREWRGKKYKKVAQGKWRRIYDSETRGAKMSIARLKKQVENANSIDELFDIVMNNTHRFSDANGKPLAIVKELKAAVDEKKSRLNAGKPSTKEQIDNWKKQNKKKGVAARLRDEFTENTNKYLDHSFKNNATGIEAKFSKESQKELKSRTDNTKSNGFTLKEHFEVANQIKELFENATLENTHDDTKHGENNVKIERFLSKEITLKSGKKAQACITVKHSLDKDGRIIYSLEAMDIKNALEKTRAKGQPNNRTVHTSNSIPDKADSVNEIKDWATYKKIHGISDDREETMQWFIKSYIDGTSSFYPDSKRKKNLYDLFEKCLEEDYRLLTAEVLHLKLSKDNFLEELGSYIIRKSQERDFKPLTDRVIKNSIKKVASVIKGIQAFKKYHGEPVQRDLSKNEVAKAQSFDELEHIFDKQGIQFDKLLKTCHFESVKKACIGITEFMHDFPFLGRLKLKTLSLHKGKNSFIMFARQEGANLRIGFDFRSFETDLQKYLSGKTRLLSKYFNAGDGHVTVESMGYHEMAHHLDNVIRHSALRSTGHIVDSEAIINKAFENVRSQMKDLTRDEAFRSISGYALENHWEAFAEAFADYYIFGEKNCNPLAREIVNIAKELYNEHNELDGGRTE